MLHVLQFAVMASTRGQFSLDSKTYFVLGDDAMISMRYARNLASGLGLSWNEGERVEGYTNFLWTLVMSVVHLTGVQDRFTSLIVMSLALAAGVATVWLVFDVADAAKNPSLDPKLAAIVAGASLQMANWGAEGFETSLLALLAIASLWLLQRQRHGMAGVALALGILTRDDFAAFATTFLIVNWASQHDRFRWESVASLVRSSLFAVPLLAGVAHSIFRYAYYGDVLPNTYRLKVEGWELSTRLGYGLRYALYALPAVALSVLGAGFGWRRTHRPARIVQVLFPLTMSVPSLYLLYGFWVGGDAFVGTRLLAPAWPYMAIGVAMMIASVRNWAPTSVSRNALAASCIVLFLFSPLQREAAAILYGYRTAIEGLLHWSGATRVGWIGRLCRPVGEGVLGRTFLTATVRGAVDASVANVLACHAIRKDAGDRGVRTGSIAVYFAGVAPYFCWEFKAIDILGKSDRHVALGRTHRGKVAHNKWDYDYSLGTLRPNYFISLLPSRSALTSVAYRRQSDGELNWHHLLESNAFWTRCSKRPISETTLIVFNCSDDLPSDVQ